MASGDHTNTEVLIRSDYRDLSVALQHAGMLDRLGLRDALPSLITLALLTTAPYWVAYRASSVNQLQLVVLAFISGLILTRWGFVMHDAGHGQISAKSRINRSIGLVSGNLIVGVSYGWWCSKHSAHHAFPNQEGRDPDISGLAIAFSETQALRRRSKLARTWMRCQGYLLLPMLLFEGLNLQLSGFAFIAKLRPNRRLSEIAFLSAHYLLLMLLLIRLLSFHQAIEWLIIQSAALGLYAGLAFATNHKGMPILSMNSTLTFAARQVITSRNVSGGRLVTWAMGGLNYQIEHHLFPSMPRRNLRAAAPLVRTFCQRNGLSYTEMSWFRSTLGVLSYLHNVGNSHVTSTEGAHTAG